MEFKTLADAVSYIEMLEKKLDIYEMIVDSQKDIIELLKTVGDFDAKKTGCI